MRYCNSCRRITAGSPAYCDACGRSFDVKRCGRGHENARSAEACSTCGSRDLSTPHVRPTFTQRILRSVVVVVPGFALLLLSFSYLWVFLLALIRSPSQILPLMLLALPLGALWFLWIHISAQLRELLYGARNSRNRR